jgi:ABC-type xylose transport system permease subunit
MDEHRSPRGRHTYPVGGDLIIPIAAVAFTLYYFSSIISSPWEAQVNAFFVGSILIVLVVVQLVRSGRMLLTGEGDLSLGALLGPTAMLRKRLLLLALTIGYVVVIEWLGFTLTTFLFLTAAMFLLNDGRRPGFIVGLAAALALGGYLLFIVAFQTRFPMGPLEHLLGTVL